MYEKVLSRASHCTVGNEVKATGLVFLHLEMQERPGIQFWCWSVNLQGDRRRGTQRESRFNVLPVKAA